MYSQIPNFIKEKLDSIDKGKFSIAEPYQKWSASCVVSKKNPFRQFKSAYLNKNSFVINFKCGGLAPQDDQINLYINKPVAK